METMSGEGQGAAQGLRVDHVAAENKSRRSAAFLPDPPPADDPLLPAVGRYDEGRPAGDANVFEVAEGAGAVMCAALL